MKLILLSGLAGAGKTVALRAVEDAGYFAVDNLPTPLLRPLIETMRNEHDKVVVSIDVRTHESIGELPEIIEEAKASGVDCRLVFLEANDDSLARRFAESRRPHPLAERITSGVPACIAEERRLLASIAELGHHIDTSDVRPNTLRRWIKDWLDVDASRLSLAFQSFGFKHGIPRDADMVFDARFLPNPYYDPALRPLSGKDAAVKTFLESDLNVTHYVDDIASFVLRWLPSFVRDNRAALTIAIGCTGGQHRSVFIVEELALRFGSSEQVLVRHRDLS
jgi:RNase adapter protein RapZ